MTKNNTIKVGDKVKIKGRINKENYFIVHNIGAEIVALHKEGGNNLFGIKLSRLQKIIDTN